MGKPGNFTEVDTNIIAEHVESLDVQKQLFAQDAFIKHRESFLNIEIPIEKIKQQKPGSYELIECKARLTNGTSCFNGNLTINCLVAWGHWHKLGNLKEGKINLIEHLDKLLPKTGKNIGFLTFQNGIQNKFAAFKEMGEEILKDLKGEPACTPLCIGIHNETNGELFGLSDDLNRLLDEWGLNGLSMLFFRQMLFTFAKLLPNINPELLWAHMAHSEAGKIAQMVLAPSCNKLSETHNKYLRKHLLTATFGAVSPIPDDVVVKATNICSKYDIVRLLPYDKKKCTVTIVENINSWIPGTDHSFLGDTYKAELKKHLASLKKDFGVYHDH